MAKVPSFLRGRGRGIHNVAAFVVVLTASLFVASSGWALERIRIALSVRNVVFLPFYYAKDTKIFDRHGLDAELIQMRSDLQLAGLISGEIDFTLAVVRRRLVSPTACRLRRWRSFTGRRFFPWLVRRTSPT